MEAGLVIHAESMNSRCLAGYNVLNGVYMLTHFRCNFSSFVSCCFFLILL